MGKRVSVYKNKSLRELDWTPGELVAFDNLDPEWPQPLILGHIYNLRQEDNESHGDLRVIFGDYKSKEKWIAQFFAKPCGLFDAKDRKPEYVDVTEGFRNGFYILEKAIAGQEEVVNYLKSLGKGFDLYADLIEAGKLQEVVQRQELGLLQKLRIRVGLSKKPVEERVLRFV